MSGNRSSSLAAGAHVRGKDAGRSFPQTITTPKKKKKERKKRKSLEKSRLLVKYLIVSLIFLFDTLTVQLFLVFVSHPFTSPLH